MSRLKPLNKSLPKVRFGVLPDLVHLQQFLSRRLPYHAQEDTSLGRRHPNRTKRTSARHQSAPGLDGSPPLCAENSAYANHAHLEDPKNYRYRFVCPREVRLFLGAGLRVVLLAARFFTP